MKTDWTTPAGRTLLIFSEAIKRKGLAFTQPLVVFGSAPLQICLEPFFLSSDVDIAASEHRELLRNLVEEIGFKKGKASFYIEVVAEYIFRPGPNWRERAELVTLNEIDFLFPAPLDILLAKLRRLEEKDILAFELVRERTGQPSEMVMLRELQASYDLFFIQKNGEKSALWQNSEKLWPRLFKRKIDVRAEIILPVLAELAESGNDLDYLNEIKTRLGI